MRDGSATKKKLERCALTLFVKNGYTETTIKDIAAKAKIAEGTMYRHYPSKDSLAEHIFMSNYQIMAETFKEIADQHVTLKEKIPAMVLFFCQQFDEDPILFSYLLLSQHHQLRKMSESKANAHLLLRGIFEAALKNQERCFADPDFCAAVTLGIVFQAALSRIYNRIKGPMVPVADDLNAAIIRALDL